MRIMTRAQKELVDDIFSVAGGRLDVVEQAFGRARNALDRNPTAKELKQYIRQDERSPESTAT